MNDCHFVWNWWYTLFLIQGLLIAPFFRKIFYHSESIVDKSDYNKRPENANFFHFSLFLFFVIGCTPLAYIVVLSKFFNNYYHGIPPFETTESFILVSAYKKNEREKLKQKRQRLRQSKKGINSPTSKTSLSKKILLNLYK